MVLPRYRGVDAGTFVESFPVSVGGFTRDAGFFDAPLGDGARALLVDCPELFDRPALYGSGNDDYPDNPRRFAFLARAALEFAARRSPAPSIVHAHDWQAALAPVYLRIASTRTHPVLGGMPSVFTIHNLAYQGLFDAGLAAAARSRLGPAVTIDRLEFWGRISFLKGGIIDADVHHHRQPTLRGGNPDAGVRLRVRRHPPRAARRSGRHPERHRHARVGSGDAIRSCRGRSTPTISQGRPTRKRAVLARYGLPADDAALRRPLIGMVSRMVDQKGFDLIAAVADELPQLDATFVVLGTGEPRYQDMWRRWPRAYPDRRSARASASTRRWRTSSRAALTSS